jgi:hypothetical protein
MLEWVHSARLNQWLRSLSAALTLVNTIFSAFTTSETYQNEKYAAIVVSGLLLLFYLLAALHPPTSRDRVEEEPDLPPLPGSAMQPVPIKEYQVPPGEESIEIQLGL